MSGQFFKQLFGKLCPHRFSWPHSGVHGRDYQVCLICGATYEYDWTTMRRTGQVAVPQQARETTRLEDSGERPITKDLRTQGLGHALQR
jgi:hypothetical protein